MLSSRKTAAPANGKLYVEDVFSTYLYTGNGSSQTITNGIDLAGKGGLVWFKPRSIGIGHRLFDTARGINYGLRTETTGGNYDETGSVTSFNSDGVSIGSSSTAVNGSGYATASWTFRKAKKFFDVVTYTGNGVGGNTISHSLGVAPGLIIVKKTNAVKNWVVYHRSQDGKYLFLNATDAASTAGAAAVFGNGTTTVTPSSTSFTVGTDDIVNGNGDTYVAYLFAHDTASDGMIQCGSYTGNGFSGAVPNVVTLGWEPQWVMVKKTSSSSISDWFMFDTMRGMPVRTSNTQFLSANTTSSEIGDTTTIEPTATGFQLVRNYTGTNANGETYIYIAIRRPMKVPTSGTSVFAPVISSGSTGGYLTTGFPVDYQLLTDRNDGSYRAVIDRLRGVSTLPSSGYSPWLSTNITTAETASNYFGNGWDNTGFRIPNYGSGISGVYYNFRRAPGFFDVVCYTGTGAARTVNHSLGVVPELMIVKARSAGEEWFVYSANLAANEYLQLNQDFSKTVGTTNWNSTRPTSTVFSLGATGNVNGSGVTHVAYLFASCPGVSKVGSYTGNGSSQTINCGFAAGARFVLIKRTDSTGDWYVWDTARGIVSGNDPHLSLNTTAAEVTTDDTIDPDASGFIVNQVAATNVNVNAATYIYLAIA